MATTFARILVETLRQQLLQTISVNANLPKARNASVGRAGLLTGREAQSFSIRRELQGEAGNPDRDQLARLGPIRASKVDILPA